jgi:uncharacterized HAD superfamily protein
MRIGIDVDDTITNSYDLILDLIGKVYNKDTDKLKAEGVNYSDIMKDHVNFPNYNKFMSDNFDKVMPNVTLKENAKEIINKLHDDGHKIIIITARDDEEYSNPYMATYLYLVKHDIMFDKIFINIKDKGSLCKKENIDIFIDDSITNCKSAINNGINTLLFDSTFNRKNNDIKRVLNWNDVYKIINENKKE